MKTFGRLAALLLVFAAAPSFAAITCTVAVPTPITVVYDPTVNADNVTTGRYTITCNRLATDASSIAWSLAANNGQHNGGGSNRAQSAGGQRYSYDLYLPPYTNGIKWQGGNVFTGTLNFGASLTASVTGTFDIWVFKQQPVQPASTYTDQIAVTLKNTANNNTLDTSTFLMNIVTTNACQLAVPPGDINLNYTANQVAAATANTSFGVRCTTALPYTMALDATSGTIVSLNYTLALSQASATGSGLVQTYSVNGSIAGGQAGKCATATCSGSQTRTLTITY